MRSTIIQFGYLKNPGRAYLKLYFVVFIFLLISISGFTQEYSFEFSEAPLSKALVEVSRKMSLRISFDAGKLHDFKITCKAEGDTPEEVLTSLLSETPYHFDFKFQTYLILQNQENKITPAGKNFLGIVYDRETGERLPYASIYVKGGTQSYTTTVEGTFSLRINDTNRVQVQIKYLGYFPLDTLISPADKNFLSLGLLKKVQNLQPVDVTGYNLEMVDVGEDAEYVKFNPSRFSDLPNYGETDVFRILQLLPGISSFENSSQLNIRGSSADQNLVLFDGFTLYNLDHFFGAFSALNPNVIKNVMVYRGGFDSRYGERVSGIVDITGKTGNQNKARFYGGLNLISGNLTAEIPITPKWTIVAAGRRAYSDIYSSWFADALLSDKLKQSYRLPVPDANVLTPKFYFSDYNLKTTYCPNQKESISLSLYGAKDNLNSSNTSVGENGKMDTKELNDWGNYGFGISWKKQWSPSYFIDLQAGHSGYFNDYYNYTVFTLSDSSGSDAVLTEETNESNDLLDYFLSFNNTLSLNESNMLQFGYSGKYNRYRYYKDASRNYVYNNLEDGAFLNTLFAQDRITFLGDRLVIKPGFRTSLYSKTGKIYIEPRFSGRYKTNGGVVLKLATGRYFQFLNKSATEQSFGYNRDFWILVDDDRAPVVSSNHFIVGASFEKGPWFFDLEAYYKNVKGFQEYLFFQNPRQHNQPSDNPGGESQPLSQFISGKGKAYGIDFLAKFESGHFTSWLAYSLSKATRRFSEINSGDEIPALYDQPHEFKWTNIYSYGRWNFSTLMVYTSGKPYIESSQKDDYFNTVRVYKRLPDYFRFDLSLNYRLEIGKARIKPGLSVLNAFNTQNYLDVYTRVFEYPDNPVNETTLVKAQSITLNFFVNFSF